MHYFEACLCMLARSAIALESKVDQHDEVFFTGLVPFGFIPLPKHHDHRQGRCGLLDWCLPTLYERACM